MIAPEETSEVDSPTESPEDRPVSTLRGAGVRVDTARAARVAIAVGLATLVVVAAVLFVAGYRKNAQIDDLHAHSVPVVMTITYSHALLGGSGSNAAGYSSGGTYSYGGRTYTASVPDNVPRVPGATVHGVASSADPGLFSLPGVVAAEHSSASVYIVPGVLLVVAVGIGAWIIVRRQRRTAD